MEEEGGRRMKRLIALATLATLALLIGWTLGRARERAAGVVALQQARQDYEARQSRQVATERERVIAAIQTDLQKREGYLLTLANVEIAGAEIGNRPKSVQARMREYDYPTFARFVEWLKIEPGERARIVYVTATGKLYHREGCRYLKSSCLPVRLWDARERFLLPCRECQPDEEVPPASAVP
jgi:hypothetical protein